MREMKDSGIAWIGQIPKDWNIRLLSSYFTEHKCKNRMLEEHNLLSLSYGRIIRKDIETKEGLLPESFDGYNIIEDGDIVFRLTDLQNDKRSLRTGLCHERGIITSAYITLRKQQPLNPSFYHYLFHAYDLCKVFYGLGDGVRQGMNFKDLRKLPILTLSLEEQQRIAEFLDGKCAEIDQLVALQEQFIEELKAYKQSVITEAVTKGLDPNVAMKDSGSKWLGKIPTSWEIMPVKYIFTRRSQRNNPIVTKERLSLSIDKGITLYSEKTTNLDRFKEDFTQYQIAHPNDIVLNCMNMIVGAVGMSAYLGCVSPVYYVITADTNIALPKYYSYLLNIPTIRGVYYSFGKGIYAIERGEGRVNTCRLKVGYNDFGRIEIPVPSISEQQIIVDFIEQKSSEIDNLINMKQQKIEELKEYKKSMIYEYVTGKKEVPTA